MLHHPPAHVEVPVVITGWGYGAPELAVAVQVDVAVRDGNA
jgi:hypothetical protein